MIHIYVVLSCMLAATEIHEMHELQLSETQLKCFVMIQKKCNTKTLIIHNVHTITGTLLHHLIVTTHTKLTSASSFTGRNPREFVPCFC